MKIYFVLLFGICLLFGSFSVEGIEDASPTQQAQPQISIEFQHLADIEHELYRDPMATYQRITELASKLELQNGTTQAWWYFRKAQCENLLHLYQAFEQTLLSMASLITVESEPALTAQYYYFQGISMQRAGLYVQARRHYRRAMELAKQNNLTRVYVKTKQAYAYTYSLSELYDTSLKDIQSAFLEAYASKDQFLIALVNETYGAVYSYMTQYERSVSYYLKALDTYERLGYQAHVADTIYALATTYRYWQDYPLAIKFFNLYLQKVDYTTSNDIRFFGVYGLAMTLAEKGQCTAAIKQLDDALLLNGPLDYQAELHKQKAACLIKLNQLDKASLSLIAAENIFDKLPEINGSVWQLENKKLKSQLAYAKEQYQLGYDLLADYHQVFTDKLLDNANKRVANIRVAAELERQKIERALSTERKHIENLEQDAQQQKLQQHYYFIVFLCVVLLSVFVVVTVLYRNNRKMIALYVIDSLTSLYSRRFTFDYLDRVLKERQKDNSHLSLLVLDIDDFKSINDTQGHSFADEVLKKTSHCTKAVMGASDIAGRINGEEIMCVLPKTDKLQAKAIAERIRFAIKEENITTGNVEESQVTVGIGIATINNNNVDAKSLYSLADAALYRAKLSGKNGMEFSS